MPFGNLGGLGDDFIQRLLANMRIDIGKQRRHGPGVARSHHGIAHLGGQTLTTRHRGQHGVGMGGGDDLDQIGIGEERRIFDDRLGHDSLDVVRQLLDDVLGHAVEVLDFLGEHGADTRLLVARERFQRFDGQFAQMSLFDQEKAGEQAPDLARQFDAHIVLCILGQQTVRACGGGRIGRDGAARGAGAILREVMQHVLARIGVRSEFVTRRLGALFQHAQGLARREQLRL